MWSLLLCGGLSMMSQAFTPKLYNNSGTNLGLRWLFVVYVIILCNNQKKIMQVYIISYWNTANRKLHIMVSQWLKSLTSCSRFCINLAHWDQSETLKQWCHIDLAVNSFSPVLVIITMTTNSNPKLGFSFCWSSSKVPAMQQL